MKCHFLPTRALLEHKGISPASDPRVGSRTMEKYVLNRREACLLAFRYFLSSKSSAVE